MRAGHLEIENAKVELAEFVQVLDNQNRQISYFPVLERRAEWKDWGQIVELKSLHFACEEVDCVS